MHWQSPGNLIFLPVAWAILLLLYYLLRRDRRQIVTSVLLWRQVSDPRFRDDRSRAYRLLRFIRRNRSLLLELSAVTFLLLAIAGPFWRCEYPLQEKPVMLVVDNEFFSFSGMGEEVAEPLRDAIPSGKKVFIYESSPEPRKVGEVFGGENLLSVILEKIAPSGIRCSPDSLLLFLRDAWFSGEMSDVFVLSGDPLLYPYMSVLFEERFDGGAHAHPTAGILSAKWHSAREETIRVVIGVGDGSEETIPEDSRERWQAEVVLRDEEGEVSSEIAEMKPGRIPLFFEVPRSEGNYLAVELLRRGPHGGGERREDASELIAPPFFIARNRSGGEGVTVTIVSEGSPFLERFFELRSHAQSLMISSKDFFEKGAENTKQRNVADILIFDGVNRDPDILRILPEIRKGICFFAPQAECPPLFRIGEFDGSAGEKALYQVEDHPILRNVTVRNVRSRYTGLLDPGPWPQKTLLRTSLSPVLTTGTIAGRPFVVFLYTPEHMARILGNRFPMVLENILEFLHTSANYGIPASVARGERMSSDILTGAELSLVGLREGDMSFTNERSCFIPYQNGFYEARSRDRVVFFTVNDHFTGLRKKGSRLWRAVLENRRDQDCSVHASPGEGDGMISSSTTLSFVAGEGEGDIGETGGHSLTPYIAAVAFLLLLAEWHVSVKHR